MTLVETIEVGSGGAASIEFTSIPQDGVDLMVLIGHRTVITGSTLTLNDTGLAGDDAIYVQGNGSAAQSNAQSSAFIVGADDSYTANTFGNAQIYISNYTSSTNKSVSVDAVAENNATTAIFRISAIKFSITSAITSVKFAPSTGNIEQYSTASLYKIS
jgi:hypothetical protein